jgi:trigger factor
MYGVKVKKTGASKVLLEVTISSDVVNNEFKRCYDQIMKEAEIPGFRKGKAPIGLIKERFGKKVYEEVLRNLVSEYFISALREKQITPVEHPQFNVKKFADNNELIFTAEFEVKPEVKIVSYKGLKVEKKHISVTSEEINRAIDYLREQKAEFSPILEVRGVKEGDFLTVDYSCYIDSKLIDKKENVLLSTKDTAFPKEFIEQLLGMNIGEEKQIVITLPSKFSNRQWAGKPATFKVKIKNIKKKSLPSFDDEFAKDLGFDSLDKLRSVISEDIKKQKESQARTEMQSQIIEQLLKRTSVQVPEDMLKQQTDVLVQNAKNRLKRTPEGQEINQSDHKVLAERLKPEGERQLKIFFILDKIAEQENIVVEDEEVDNRINILAAQMGQSAEKVRRDFEEKGIISQLKGQIKDEKTLDFLLKEAEVKEVE